jgi:hypothetical protein
LKFFRLAKTPMNDVKVSFKINKFWKSKTLQ